MEQQDLIRMEHITKKFGSLKANDSVNLSVMKGEVHAILGENGAGKSTLMNILSGIYTPDGGTIYLRGDEQLFLSPQHAIDSGIGMIYQHFKLAEAMTAWENICAGPDGPKLLNPLEIRQNIEKIFDKWGLRVDLQKRVLDMEVSEKQTLEIIKVLYRGADILIFDEPTTVLTPQETERLFQMIRSMCQLGKTAIIITHKLNEVMDISKRVTILQKGKSVATVETEKTSQKELAELMVGKAMEMRFPYIKAEKREIVMQVKNLTVDDIESMRKVQDISFELNGGEILGVAGVSGNGQRQLCEGLTGLQKVEAGEIWVKGKNIAGLSARDIYSHGVSLMNFVPEDRLGMGLIATMSLVENVMLRNYRKGKGVLLDKKSGIELTKQLVESLEVKHPGIHRPIRSLSGGNMQKILVGREIISRPEILIAAYPVRGLDLGVTHKVIDLMNDQKKKGNGVLIIAEDLDLLLEVADRIMVLYNGKVTGIVNAEDTSKEELGLLMTSEVIRCTE